MSDLLRARVARRSRRAARPQRPAEEAQPAARSGDSRNPRHVVESLNSLSVDIARAIDHDASVDLWRRYQRGERDVFTRRLYTLKGQQTFDEIKRKYDREPEFRTAVDRYIADFEKLLADVARTDPDKHGHAVLPDVGYRQGLYDARPRRGRFNRAGRPARFDGPIARWGRFHVSSTAEAL